MSRRKQFIRNVVERMLAAESFSNPLAALRVASAAAHELQEQDPDFFFDDEPPTEIIDAKIQFAVEVLRMRGKTDSPQAQTEVMREFFK